jgi:reactive intermediate/imine deaminase
MPHVIETADAPAAPADFSQAVVTGDLVFTAGQVPMTPTGEIRAGDPLADQTRLCLENLEAVLQEAGATPDDVLKTTVYLVDMGGFDRMNDVYQGFFGATMPARSVVETSDVLKGADIEIEAVAVRDA